MRLQLRKAHITAAWREFIYIFIYYVQNKYSFGEFSSFSSSASITIIITTIIITITKTTRTRFVRKRVSVYIPRGRSRQKIIKSPVIPLFVFNNTRKTPPFRRLYIIKTSLAHPFPRNPTAQSVPKYYIPTYILHKCVYIYIYMYIRSSNLP